VPIVRLTTLIHIVMLALAATAPARQPQPPGDPQPNPHTRSQDQAPLIPRDLLFANPDRAQVRLSPDGLWISYLAPFDGVMNIWLRPADARDDSAARPITFDRDRGVRRHWWTHSGRHLLYAQDSSGDENWRLFALDISAGAAAPLTPPTSQARLVAILPDMPGEVLVALNNRDPELHDLHAIDLATGQARLVRLAPPGATDWIVDRNGAVRFVERALADGGLELARPEPDGSWTTAITIPADDAVTCRVLGFGADPATLYLSDSRGRDTAALVRIDLVSGESGVLAESGRADLDDVLRHPRTGDIQAASFVEQRRRWVAVDDAVAADIRMLATIHDGDPSVVSRSLDDRRWLLAYTDDDGPVGYYLYERGKTPTARFLFNHRDGLEDAPLAPMHAVSITASDGLELPSYLTMPLGAVHVDADHAGADHADGVPAAPAQRLPMVLLVHGGPWGRDSWGFNPLHQLLANRGYAVLSVNFRASTGLGKAFVNAGDREWGGRIQQDLTDAVHWAIDQGIADPARIAIMGGSFGGYAAQAGLAFTPDLYACGVSLVGPSDLTTLLESIPPYWAPLRALFARRVGDISTPEGRRFLLSRSPLTHAGNIKRPLLLIHGANDPRVRLSESQRMAMTLDQNGIPATLVVFPDEGHGLVRPENNLAFIALAEAFLAQHLGGRYQPIDDDVSRSSACISIGAERLHLPVSGRSDDAAPAPTAPKR
jgi:dipeptidyl aminopeptidase/acylaminoacyl peptidase